MGQEDVDMVVDLVRRAAVGRTVLMVEHNLVWSVVYVMRLLCWRAALF